MDRTLADLEVRRPHKMLLDPFALMGRRHVEASGLVEDVGESDRKRLAELEAHRRTVGQTIEQALAWSGLTKQEAAARMGYVDRRGVVNQAPISRWIVGIETPQVAKLYLLGAHFRRTFLVLLLKAEGIGMEVVMHVPMGDEQQ